MWCSAKCRHRGAPDPDAVEWPPELLALQLGPAGQPYTVERLRAVWAVWRARLLSPDHLPALPGVRPWAHWHFDLAEDQPEAWDPEARRCRAPDPATLRLAELGLLRDDELATLEARADEARARIGTDAERFSGGGRDTGVPVDVQAVELWESVAARQERER